MNHLIFYVPNQIETYPDSIFVPAYAAANEGGLGRIRVSKAAISQRGGSTSTCGRRASTRADRGRDNLTHESCNTRPRHRAGTLPDDPIVPTRSWRTMLNVRSTSREHQAWKHIIDDDGTLKVFKCPNCHHVIEYDHRGFPGCDHCAYTMTRAELDEMEAHDPDMIPARQFMQKAESWVPSFEGHANKKKICGEERRQKRFLSKSSY